MPRNGGFSDDDYRGMARFAAMLVLAVAGSVVTGLSLWLRCFGG